MAQSPTASDTSHDSGDEAPTSIQGKHTAVKDKECPYCHQKFTSSSLGRHLDQFLNKKKPDGLHNVEEIRKLRSGITRRTARGSRKTGDGGHDSPVHDASRTATQSPRLTATHGTNPLSAEIPKPAAIESRDGRFNPRVGWEATGVITDSGNIGANQFSKTTNASPVSVTQAGFANGLAGTKRSFTTYSSDLFTPAASSNEHARALELSLREVLDAVNVATRKAAPLPQPFPFDLTAQTFPGLCLKLLPHPPTLFQTNPFATSDTISLQPPGIDQLHALRTKIRYILDDWKWDALAHAQKNSTQEGLNVGQEAARITQRANQQIDESLQHLDMAFQYFATNPPDTQCRIWDLELLRAHKSEQDSLKAAKEQIARITQEAAQLQQQVEHLSKCQWPREMALWPPVRNTFASAVQKELAETRVTSLDRVMASGTRDVPGVELADEERWDFDHLVNKWKRHVREDRARRAVNGNTAMLPPGDHIDRTGTPPVGLGFGNLRKSVSDGVGQNGFHHDSRTNSPITRNGQTASLGITDKPITFASQDYDTPSGRTIIATSAAHSNPSSSRAQTPFNSTNIGIISDPETLYGRMEPYYKQKAAEEQREREMMGD